MKTEERCSRYAGALFEAARDRGCLGDVERDLHRIADLMRESPELRRFTDLSAIPPDRRMDILRKLFAGRVHGMTFRFIERLDHDRLLPLLPRVAVAYEKMHRKHLGFVPVRIVSARPLGGDLVHAMAEKIGKRYGKRVEPEIRLDASLLGGVRVQIGDEVHDYSLATQLERLREAFGVA